ncbi:hypothetical protein HYU11_06475 [Candidatus Woesearchaeota archaeon]|nr:hypothetical protein [Candidatus Woesearchaeota archaeon]
MTSPFVMSEQEYDDLLERNMRLGFVFYTDIMALEKFQELRPIEIPRKLPRSVYESHRNLVPISDVEFHQLEGIEAFIDGVTVNYYIKYFKQPTGQLAPVGLEKRQVHPVSGKSEKNSVFSSQPYGVGASYQIAGFPGDWQGIYHGMNYHSSLEDAADALLDRANEYYSILKEAMTHDGLSEGQGVINVSEFSVTRKKAPLDLATQMLYAFTYGFYRASEHYKRPDLTENVSKVLDILGNIFEPPRMRNADFIQND